MVPYTMRSSGSLIAFGIIFLRTVRYTLDKTPDPSLIDLVDDLKRRIVDRICEDFGDGTPVRIINADDPSDTEEPQ